MDRQQTSDEWDAMLQKKKPMTDTLREECEAYSATLPVYRDGDFRYQDTITDWLIAFARSQQAQGLKEAAGIADGWIEGKLIARDICLAATALEKGKAPHL